MYVSTLYMYSTCTYACIHACNYNIPPLVHYRAFLEIISISGTPKLMKYHGTFLPGVSALMYCIIHTVYHYMYSFPAARTVTERKPIDVRT